ncbi:hypothetical protein OG21DRAFT_1494390 [Imleria badia]|nr:hypothetical protein OG21DRAFT_1494390 [Imleria badia]
MSIHAQSQFSLAVPPPQLAVDVEVPDFRLPRNYVHSSNLPTSIRTTEGSHFHQLCAEEHSTAQYANQAYTARSMFTHVNQQTQFNPTLWRSTQMEIIPEPLAASSPTVVKDAHEDDMTSASHSAYDPGSYGVQWDSDVAFELSNTVRSINTSNIHFLPHPIPQDVLPLPKPSEGPERRRLIYLASPYLTPIMQFIFALLLPSPNVNRDSTASSLRRRGARAIEYGGLWVDEAELFEGLTEPNGKLYVHQCLWEEDRSPCHLWIKSDKSCINAHIQKWHGGRPGGDKLEAECRWSACGKRMLKESIARHILSIHLGEMRECRGCGKGIARKDAYERHVVKAESEGCRIAGALVTYSAEVRVIDARAALDGGGRMRCADA